MSTELKRRYIKGENIFWIGLVLLTTVSLSTVVFLIVKKGAGEGCALDMAYVIADPIGFSMIALAAGIFNMKAIQADFNSKIVMKYKTKRRLWLIQGICSCISAFTLGAMVTLTALLNGYCIFGRFYNWESRQSFYRYSLLDRGHDYTVVMTPFLIIIVSWIMTSLLFLMTFFLGMLVNNITRSFSAAIVFMVIVSGADSFVSCFYSKLNLHLFTLASPSRCLTKFGVVIVINIVLFIVGFFIAPFREYYDKEV